MLGRVKDSGHHASRVPFMAAPWWKAQPEFLPGKNGHSASCPSVRARLGRRPYGLPSPLPGPRGSSGDGILHDPGFLCEDDMRTGGL